MLIRILEPEVMDTAEEARDYDAMDHSGVNEAFVDDFLAAVQRFGLEQRLQDAAGPFQVLDCGTGTALIPIALCRRPVSAKVTAVDLSDQMLELARRNAEAAGFEFRIDLRRADCKSLPFADASFGAVMSNSIVHHVPEPKLALAEMVRVLGPGGLLFIRDLLRPESEQRVTELVETCAGQESERQKAMFRDSLRAALTLDEVRGRLRELGLSPRLVEQTSDRHWTIAGRIATRPEPSVLS
jgi:ubiquinone/menaquinone biosynthesis C-methylase UbiE